MESETAIFMRFLLVITPYNPTRNNMKHIIKAIILLTPL